MELKDRLSSAKLGAIAKHEVTRTCADGHPEQTPWVIGELPNAMRAPQKRIQLVDQGLHHGLHGSTPPAIKVIPSTTSAVPSHFDHPMGS